MVVVQEYQRCGDDRTNAPGIEANVAQCSEGHLQQRVATLAGDRYSTASGRTDSVAVYVTPEFCVFSLYLNGFGARYP